MTLTLEERMDMLEANEYKWQHMVDEQLSELTKMVLANIVQMKTWNEDIRKHFESHYLDKKKREENASKRKRTRY